VRNLDNMASDDEPADEGEAGATLSEQPAPGGFVADPELCGRFVAWFAAARAGRVDRASAVAAIEAGSDGHVVTGWSDGDRSFDIVQIPDVGTPLAELRLPDVFARLLDTGVRRASLVLPVTGDPLGLTGAGAFSVAAIAAETGVLLVTDRARLGLVPTPDRRGSSYRGWRWRMYVEPITPFLQPTVTADFAPVGDLPPVEPQRVVEQADRALSRALRDATDELAALDLAHWRPEVAVGRKAAEAALRAAGQRMPAGWPPPARALAERALMLWHIVRVARSDAGAASASGSQARSEALRILSHAIREAAMIAYNVPVLELPLVRRADAPEPDSAASAPRPPG
jgi:hypothetical protein